ncbi:MAG TPA: hypothetical protein VLL25_16830 [Acidimicrobiales bacterium]|nr:hypothetical protein [Acidimicrobiales bacterium]
MGRNLADPSNGAGPVAPEHGGVLRQRNALGRVVEFIQVEIGGTSVSVVKLRPADAELGAQLDQRQDLSLPAADTGSGGIDRCAAAHGCRRVLPTVRTGEVNQLPGGQVRSESWLDLALDHLPSRVGDGRQLA